MKNRFISKEVENAEYLKNLCRYIHQNPYKAGISSMEEYQWSSYKEYIDEKEALLQFKEFHKYNSLKNELCDFLEYEIGEKLSDEKANKYIADYLEIESCLKIAEYNIEKRNEYLQKIKEFKKVTKRQIARIPGLSEKIVERAMK